MKIDRKEIIILGIFILVLILLRIPSIFEPHWYSDEGYFATIANSSNFGLKLYNDLWTQFPPGAFFPYFLSNFAGNYSLNVLKIINLLSSIISIILIYKISRNLFSKRTAVLSVIISLIFFSTPLIEANIATQENFYLLFILLSIYSLFIQKNFSLFLSGLFLGIAIVFSIKPVFIALAVLVYLIIARKKKDVIHSRNISLYLIGILVPLVLTGLWMNSQGILENFYEQVISYNINSILNHEGTGLGLIVIKNSFFAKSILFSIITFLTIILYRNKSFNNSSFLLSLLTIGFSFSLLVSKEPYAHCLIPVIPVFSIITSLVIFKLGSAHETNKKVVIIAIYILSIFFLLNLFTGGKQIRSSSPLIDYYANFINYLIKKTDSSSYIKFFSNDTYRMYRLNNYLSQNYPNEDNIYVWTNNPWIYSLNNIKPPVRYIQSYKAEENLGEVKTDLQVNNPALIITDNNSAPCQDYNTFILDNNYFMENEFEEYEIFIKND